MMQIYIIIIITFVNVQNVTNYDGCVYNRIY